MFSIFPLQDLFGLKQEYVRGRDPKLDRINVPSIPEHYWRFRIHIQMEDLLKDDNFALQIGHLLQMTGRGI